MAALVLIRYGYNCVIYGWDPTCMMGHEWIRNMNVHSLPHGHHQPFYNVLVEDGSCRYAAQGEWRALSVQFVCLSFLLLFMFGSCFEFLLGLFITF